MGCSRHPKERGSGIERDGLNLIVYTKGLLEAKSHAMQRRGGFLGLGYSSASLIGYLNETRWKKFCPLSMNPESLKP